MEKKFAVFRITEGGEDRLCIVPVFIESISLQSARRKVLAEYKNGTAAWVGWVDKYIIFDSVKPQ